MANSENRRHIPLKDQIRESVAPRFAETYPLSNALEERLVDVAAATLSLHTRPARKRRQRLVDNGYDVPFADYLKEKYGSLESIARERATSGSRLVFARMPLFVAPLAREEIGLRELQIRVSTLPKFLNLPDVDLEPEDKLFNPYSHQEIEEHPDMQRAVTLYTAVMSDEKLAEAALAQAPPIIS